MWNIMYNKKGEKTILHGSNPKCYICDRFFTDEKYRKFSKLNLAEIVSADSMLFPKKELLAENCCLSEDFSKIRKIKIFPSQQILIAAFIFGKENPFKRPIEGFEFLGYDLTDEFETSALTNCGGYFDKVFTQEDLTEYGLISDLRSALEIRDALSEKYPDEEHADCVIFALWRRIEDNNFI